MKKILRPGFFAVQFLSTCALAGTMPDADRDSRIREELRDFRADPAAFMSRLPSRTRDGAAAQVQPLPGPEAAAARMSAELERLGPHRRLPGRMLEPVTADDRAADLVDELQYTSPEKMERAGLLSANLATRPWSGTYWPIAQGVIAWRYSDPAFPGDYNWKDNADYLRNPASTCSVEQLSPAEKYDLLVGDSSGSLTQAMLAEGQQYYDVDGRVESWMGICHGWSPASYMTARPAKTVEVLAADGRTRIPFYPADLKALASLLWANGTFENKFIGRRCDSAAPAHDENGRVTDPGCYGENPGTWHLAVVNQIGGSHRAFVLDAMHDMEIWNQPVYGYRYSYFNPETQNPAETLQAATVAMADFGSDRFKRYRSPAARFAVGIAMDLTYVSETPPSAAPTDDPSRDATVTVHYFYDLELNERREIVGGEWYSAAHPGFLWTPAPGAHALSTGDQALAASDPRGAWDGRAAIPASWAAPIQSSSQAGQPLARIVDALNVLSALQ